VSGYDAAGGEFAARLETEYEEFAVSVQDAVQISHTPPQTWFPHSRAF
jgi:hypothetical protein